MTGQQKISLPLHQCVVASDPKIVTLRAGCDVVIGAREDNDWERRSMQEFDGRTAFVTGGASGIGLAMKPIEKMLLRLFGWQVEEPGMPQPR